jgi:hypothetical protein
MESIADWSRTDLTTPLSYLSGPANLVAAMRQIFTDTKVHEDNMRTEAFSGDYI